MRAPLTGKQREIYKFFVNFIRENKYSPSIREINKHFKFNSNNSANYYLKALEEKGYIIRNSNGGVTKARAIRLVDDVIGNYSVESAQVHKALKNLKIRGYIVGANEAVELLSELSISVL